MRSTEARVFWTPDDEDDGFLPEGPRPVTLGGRDALMWVNIQTGPAATRGAVHLRFWDDGEQGVWNLSGRPGFALPTDRPGTVFVGLEKAVVTLDLETNETTPLAAIPDDTRLILINHWPLRRDHAVLPRIPRFSIWCGTRKTEDWHRRFPIDTVVYGHLHLRETHELDGVRFEEVSLGYPPQWNSARGVRHYLRKIR